MKPATAAAAAAAAGRKTPLGMTLYHTRTPFISAATAEAHLITSEAIAYSRRSY